MTIEHYEDDHTEIQDFTQISASFSKNALGVIDPLVVKKPVNVVDHSNAPISNMIETISNNFCHETPKHMLFSIPKY